APDVVLDTRGGESWRFTVEGEREAVAAAWRGIEAILLARDVPPATVHDCVLAVEELLTNVVTHAYGGQPGHRIVVGLELPPGDIRIRLEDTGPPFNPLEAPAPDLESP